MKYSRIFSAIVALFALALSAPISASERLPEKPLQQDVIVVERATKVAQLVGEYDRERKCPTADLTLSRYKLDATDLGVSFRHKGRTYILFGDTSGVSGGDAIAYTTGTSPENGLELVFVHHRTGAYKPIDIPGISQDDFEVPVAGTSVKGRMYVYHTTDHSKKVVMGRCVVAASDDDGETFRYLYDLSTKYFINVSLVQTDLSQWTGFPTSSGPGLVMLGSGTYRNSDVRLAFQPAEKIESPDGIEYFSGLDSFSRPMWSLREEDAVPLFHQPCVGELSVSYNKFIRKWIMLYNCGGEYDGINMRTADFPWGPWSEPQVIFNVAADGALCRYVHVGWNVRRCDLVQDPGRENVTGGPYGPYQFEDFATGDSASTTIYFTLSTWNPYTVVVMKTTLRRLIQ